MHFIFLLTNHFLGDTSALVPALTSTSTSITNVTTVTKNIQLFVAPIFLLVIGITAFSFLLKKQMKKFIEFVILTVGVGVFFYTPGVVENIAKTIAGLFGNS